MGLWHDRSRAGNLLGVAGDARRGELGPRDTGAVLLAYSDRRPLLRLIDVDAAEVLPLPTKLDSLDDALELPLGAGTHAPVRAF